MQGKEAVGMKAVRTLVMLVSVMLVLVCCARKSDTGRLVVTTIPPDANLLWDGQPVEGLTPMALDNLTAGWHLLTAQKQGYEEVRQTVHIKPGTTARVSLVLREMKGIVLLETNPPGAEVRMESPDKAKSLFLGTTPLLLAEQLPYGTTELSLRLDDHDPKQIMVKVDSRIPLLIKEELRPRFASISINSTPQGASVFLNGEHKGTTPWAQSRLPEGKYELVVQKEGFDTYKETLQVEARSEIKKDILLNESPASIEIDSEPVKGAEVFLDGKSVGKTPLKLGGLKAGPHSLRLAIRKYSDYTKDVELKAGKTLTLVAQMEKNTGAIQLVTKPPGAEVRIDGRPEGVTKPDKSGEISEVLLIQDVEAGERLIEIVKPKYHPYGPEKITVGKDQIRNLNVISLDQMDDTIVIRKGDPTPRRGVITNRYPDGSFEFRMRMGTGYITITVKPSEVEKIEPIGNP